MAEALLGGCSTGSDVKPVKSPTMQAEGGPQCPTGSIYTATVKLLALWQAEDATIDPEKLRRLMKKSPNSRKQ